MEKLKINPSIHRGTPRIFKIDKKDIKDIRKARNILKMIHSSHEDLILKKIKKDTYKVHDLQQILNFHIILLYSNSNQQLSSIM